MGRLRGPAEANVSCAQTKRSGKASDGREMATTCYMAPRSCMTRTRTCRSTRLASRWVFALRAWRWQQELCSPPRPLCWSRLPALILLFLPFISSSFRSVSVPPLPPSSNPVYLSPAVFHSSPSLPLISPLGEDAPAPGILSHSALPRRSRPRRPVSPSLRSLTLKYQTLLNRSLVASIRPSIPPSGRPPKFLRVRSEPPRYSLQVNVLGIYL